LNELAPHEPPPLNFDYNYHPAQGMPLMRDAFAYERETNKKEGIVPFSSDKYATPNEKPIDY